MAEKLTISQWAQKLSQLKTKEEKLKEIDLDLSPNAKQVLEARYLVRDDDGEIAETPKEAFYRVAHHIAQAELKFDNSKEVANMVENAYLEILTNLEFLPNSPTFSGAGTKLGQLSACFVLPIEDDMSSIMQTLTDTVMIHKSGGGTGFSFSRLRPSGSRISTTTGTSPGPVSFMKMYDGTTEQVKQGGTRRGANMGILRVDHPDILEFIDCKKEEGKINNFNISVGITDKFIKAVKNGEKYDLYDPYLKKNSGQLDAQEVFNKIATNAWSNGEPGIFFIDQANRHNPTPKIGDIEGTNPCLTSTSWVVTPDGPAQIKDIIDKPTHLLIDGKFKPSTDKGFFKTGKKHTYKIKTDKGYSIEATDNHPVLTVDYLSRKKMTTKWKMIKELNTNDKIVLSDNRKSSWQGKGNAKKGYLLGLLIGDGTIKDNEAVISVWDKDQGSESVMKYAQEIAFELPHRSDFQGFCRVKTRSEQRLKLIAIKNLSEEYGLESGNKTITPQIEKASSNFHIGLLRGLFDADGTVIGSQNKGVSVRLWQNNLDTLEGAQRMLARLGIISTIYHDRKPAQSKLMPNGKDGHKEYLSAPGHELVISRENILAFTERVGFINKAKQKKLLNILSNYKRKLNRERFYAGITNIEKQSKEDVYDIQIPEGNKFDANGIVVHNCGEQPLLPYESCCLGSLNLARFTKEENGETVIDWSRLKYVTRLAVRFLDNLIEMNKFPIKAIEKLSKANRKIGLGVMGFADLLLALGIRYDSKEALELAGQISQYIKDNSYQASQKLAEKRGVFKNYSGSVWDERGIKMRNAACTTVAPTGTLSLIANCSSGIEPIFSVAFVRNVLDGQKLIDVNPIFEKVAKDEGFYSKKLMAKVAKNGDLKTIKKIPDKVKNIFVTAHDVKPEEHLKMQAAFQNNVDAAISKTINFHNSATIDDVKKAYLLAYDLKLKGLTIYRDGSRQSQVLEKGSKKKEDTKPVESIKAKQEKQEVTPRKRPECLVGYTFKTNTAYGNLYVTVNEDKNGRPFEVFANIGKAGGFFAAKAEAITRLVSLALRSGIKVEEVIAQIKGIRGPSPTWGKDGKIFSLPDAVAQTLERYLETKKKNKQLNLELVETETSKSTPDQDFEQSIADIGEAAGCPECGMILEFSEGCMKCNSCGYSKCS